MLAGPAESHETLTVALVDPIDPTHAPIPTNDSERLFFRYHFETLVRLDCHGEVRPGLASEWKADSTGRHWTFTLRPDARDSSGSPLTAPGVASSWKVRRLEVAALGIDSAVALDANRLSVTLRATPDSAPRLFAHPALSAATTAVAGPTVDFQIIPRGDTRDAVDRGADLVVTRDPSVAEYVANRAEFSTFPLPWTLTYALLQPGGSVPIGTTIVDSVRRSLARDVAQADARAAQPSAWMSGNCASTALSTLVTVPTSARIVYPRDDKVAQGLAERIVALARDTVPLRTAGLDAAALALALRTQNERGYVLGLPRAAAAPCHEIASLPAGATIQPLIDTRPFAIVRKGAPPLSVEWDGTLRVMDR